MSIKHLQQHNVTVITSDVKITVVNYYLAILLCPVFNLFSIVNVLIDIPQLLSIFNPKSSKVRVASVKCSLRHSCI